LIFLENKMKYCVEGVVEVSFNFTIEHPDGTEFSRTYCSVIECVTDLFGGEEYKSFHINTVYISLLYGKMWQYEFHKHDALGNGDIGDFISIVKDILQVGACFQDGYCLRRGHSAPDHKILQWKNPERILRWATHLQPAAIEKYGREAICGIAENYLSAINPDYYLDKQLRPDAYTLSQIFGRYIAEVCRQLCSVGDCMSPLGGDGILEVLFSASPEGPFPWKDGMVEMIETLLPGKFLAGNEEAGWWFSREDYEVFKVEGAKTRCSSCGHLHFTKSGEAYCYCYCSGFFKPTLNPEYSNLSPRAQGWPIREIKICPHEKSFLDQEMLDNIWRQIKKWNKKKRREEITRYLSAS